VLCVLARLAKMSRRQSLGGKFLHRVNASAPASMWMVRYAISSRSDATTSWRNERMRGWCNERAARGNAATSYCYCDKTTIGWYNERTTRTCGDATTSWHDEVTRGQRNERRHSDDCEDCERDIGPWFKSTKPGYYFLF
jgi:hypothetical protein